jgi:hypothetical protein
MRYAIFGALILSLDLLGASIATAAMPATGYANLKADSTRFNSGLVWMRR